MVQKIISQGAEAKIFLNKKEDWITKDRIPKSYRIKELDNSIRKRRTKSEIKLLTKASEIINIPLPSPGEDFHFSMPFIKGKKLSEHLDNFPLKKQKEICKQIGKDLAKLHDENIIHGDLTTSNLILVEEKNSRINPKRKSDEQSEEHLSGAAVGTVDGSNKSPKIFFVDFGLGYFNGKYEDKAVDIHLFKHALEAKHFKNWKALFEKFEKGYKISKDYKKVFERLRAVEKRGRYRH